MSPSLAIAALVLSALAAAGALWPLLRAGRTEHRGDDALAGERAALIAALSENLRDREAGRIAPNEAEATRAEIGRRLLAVDRETRGEGETRRAGAVVPILVALLAPLGAFALYSAIGAPGAPDRPLAARLAEARAPTVARGEAEELVRQAEARLAANPDEVAGWLALAPVYRALGREADAAAALERALPALEGAPRARALVELTDIEASRDGTIGEAGEARLREALALDPADGRAGFLLAMRAEEALPARRAAEAWRQLIARHEATGAPWLALARTRLAALEDASSNANAPAGDAPAAAPPPRASARPRPDAMSVPPEIRAMVDGLDARLRDNPDDPEGWLRLVRSFAVLGERQNARAAASRARAALEANNEALGQLERLEEQFGLAGPDRGTTANGAADGGAADGGARDAASTPAPGND